MIWSRNRCYQFLLCIGIICSCYWPLSFTLAQQTSDSTIESFTTSEDKLAIRILDSTLLKKQVTKPLKASILSAILPGAGQVYNRQPYKLHILYAGIGGMIYAIDYNHRRFQLYDTAYRNRLAGKDTPNIPSTIPASSLANIRAQARKDKELSYFGLGILYLMNIADAFVSSHLTTFDIEEDLVSGRLKWIDQMEWTGAPYLCLGIHIEF